MIVTFDYEGRAFTFEHPDGDHIGRQQAAAQTFYERDLLEAVREELGPAPERHYEEMRGTAAYEGFPCVIDVGAHVGNHAIYFAALGYHVFAFEPNPRALPYLARNVAQVGNVTVIGAAVGADNYQPGTQWVSVHDDHPGNSGMARAVVDPRGTTLSMTLDAIVPAMGLPVFAKIDAEGAEPAVLHGMHAILRGGRRPPLLSLEAHDAAALDAQCAILAPLGYERDPLRFCKTPTYLWKAKR